MTRDPFEELFHRGAPPVAGPTTSRRALEAYTSGFERARRRRVAGVAGSVAAFGLVVSLGIGLTLSAGDSTTSGGVADDRTEPRPSPDVSPDTDGDAATPDPTTSITTTTAPATTTTSLAGDDGGETATTTEPDGSTTAGDSPAGGPAFGSTPGGSATVVLDGGGLTIVEITTALGYISEVREQSLERVKIRFDGPEEYELRFELEDGSIVVRDEDEDENDDDDDDS